MLKNFLFTSESVTEGHPDKICDQISDALLDEMLKQDPQSRVAAETMCGTGFIHIAGEVTSNAKVEISDVARQVVKEIGYDASEKGFDADTCAVHVSLGKQSQDISVGVSEGEGLFKEQGAGDQGLMFGFACNENKDFMPSPIYYAHLLTRQLANVRHNKTLAYLRPDGKSQVSIQYENGKPVHIDTVLISSQHDENIDHETISQDIRNKVILPFLPENLISDKTKILVNPTGRFVLGGPKGDCGLTGRKIIVDTYGGWGRHGGGAFSGKDATKVDRSAAYMARYIAKNIVAAELADQCEVQLAYAIGVADPVSIMVDTFDSAKIDDEKLPQAIREIFPLKPKGIIETLDLTSPRFRATATYGHFGRDEAGFTWEKTDKVNELKSFFA
ncbi:MAG TPA: methionine adenosyltransferase [Oligoflexia bacterium]|nr:methionine adenosyltransferase [Oligoflexia bacterium]HMR24862.1 methionine adenosyltransferase [Oligoflexia bacterium]